MSIAFRTALLALPLAAAIGIAGAHSADEVVTGETEKDAAEAMESAREYAPPVRGGGYGHPMWGPMHGYQMGPMWGHQMGPMWGHQMGPMYGHQMGPMYGHQIGPMYGHQMGPIWGHQMGYPMMGGRGHFDRAALESRYAFLEHELDITDEQQPQWNAAERAMKEMAEQRRDRWSERAKKRAEGGTILDYLAMRQEHLATRVVEVDKVKSAIEALYAVLDEDQRQRLNAMAPMLPR